MSTLARPTLPRLPIPHAAARRAFAGTGARALLSATAIALLAGRGTLAHAADGSAEGDVRILNTALGAEREAIAAYGVGARSGLLRAPTLALATTFQGHHREHAELLEKTISTLGGKPVAARDAYEFPTDRLRTEVDVLRLAAQLEQGAVSAYLNAVPVFGSRELAKAAASILGDEAMHWAVLRQALGEAPVPAAFVS